jgi:hypothetical protein
MKHLNVVYESFSSQFMDALWSVREVSRPKRHKGGLMPSHGLGIIKLSAQTGARAQLLRSTPGNLRNGDRCYYID